MHPDELFQRLHNQGRTGTLAPGPDTTVIFDEVSKHRHPKYIRTLPSCRSKVRPDIESASVQQFRRVAMEPSECPHTAVALSIPWLIPNPQRSHLSLFSGGKK